MFKFRPSDATIGRFWQIDPLASDFVYNSPYALQENKFGLGVELEGKELGGFIKYAGGVVSGMAEDVSLGAFKAGSGSSEYNAGVSAGHNASVGLGVGMAGLGTGMVETAAVATVASAGTATPATAVAAGVGVGVAGYGVPLLLPKL